jgi:hypothetical protein
LSSIADFAGTTEYSVNDDDLGDENVQLKSQMDVEGRSIVISKVEDSEKPRLPKLFGSETYYSKHRLSKLHPHTPSPEFDELITYVN